MKKLLILLLLFSFFFFFFSYLSRYNKACVETCVKVNKIYDDIYDNLSHLSHFLRLSRYSEICVKIYVRTCVKIYKIYDNIYDRCYYYGGMRFNDINRFNIKAFFTPFLFFLSRLSRYDKAYDKVCVEAYVKTDKVYDNICDKYYYYNEERFSDINKLDIKDIIIFFN